MKMIGGVIGNFLQRGLLLILFWGLGAAQAAHLTLAQPQPLTRPAARAVRAGTPVSQCFQLVRERAAEPRCHSAHARLGAAARRSGGTQRSLVRLWIERSELSQMAGGTAGRQTSSSGHLGQP